MKVILNIATLGHRPDEVIDLDDDVAARLLKDGHARTTDTLPAPVADTYQVQAEQMGLVEPPAVLEDEKSTTIAEPVFGEPIIVDPPAVDTPSKFPKPKPDAKPGLSDL